MCVCVCGGRGGEGGGGGAAAAGFDSRLGSLSVLSLHVLPASVRVAPGSSGFLPQSKDMRVRRIGHAKLPLSVRGTSPLVSGGRGNIG